MKEVNDKNETNKNIITFLFLKVKSSVKTSETDNNNYKKLKKVQKFI